MADTLATMAVLIPLLLAVLLSSAASKVAEVSDFQETNPNMVNGQRIHEGDMVLTNEKWQSLTQRTALSDPNSLWPKDANGVPRIPYKFYASYMDTVRIKAGFAYWEANTCIRFYATTNTTQPYIIILPGTTGCAGTRGFNPVITKNQMAYHSSCSKRKIAHMIGHVIGMEHEHNRADRDTYILIHPDNIKDASLGKFNIFSNISSYNVPYDLSSDMHYKTKSFTKNGKPTITTIDPLKSHLIGRYRPLSFRDIKLVNIIYDCIGMWTASCSSPPTCQNEGYVGADCKCVCPPGTSGATCEYVIGDYYDHLHDGCTETITNEGVLTSPGYPNNSPAGLGCAKVLEAPACMLPQLTFTDFLLHKRTTNCNPVCCYYASLEIRMNHPNVSDLYCDTDITSGMTFTGTSRKVVVFYHTRRKVSKWSANLTFVPDPACITTSNTTVTSTNPECKVELINGIYYWTSKSFDGRTYYPNNFACGITGSTVGTAMSMVTIKAVTFLVELGDNCKYDSVSMEHLYNRKEMWCGVKTGLLFRSPSFNFKMEFKSDGVVPDLGFNISITPGSWPPYNCHKVINMVAGKTYRQVSPNYLGSCGMTSSFFCEYRFVAPANMKVKVMQLITHIHNQLPSCPDEFVLLNGDKQLKYPAATSKIFCGSKIHWNVMTTTTNELYLAFQKYYPSKYKGFRITVIAV